MYLNEHMNKITDISQYNNLKLRIIIFIIVIAAKPAFSQDVVNQDSTEKSIITLSNFEFQSSVVLEAICFTNTLVNDPFYLRYFQKDYDHFKTFFTPEVSEALSRLKSYKERKQLQLATELFLMHSNKLFLTFDDLILSLDQPCKFNSISPHEFHEILPDLKLVFSFLKEHDFENYWSVNNEPLVEKKIKDASDLFTEMNIESPIWKILGKTYAYEKMSILVSYYTKPHGKRMNQFIVTQEDISNKALLQLIIHEILHSYEANEYIKPELSKISGDKFVMKHFQNRNPSYNYNTFDGYLEENIVRVLDQVITEHFGIEKKPWRRFIKQDDGMHVLAGALYFLIKKKDYSFEKEPFSVFYLRMVKENKVGPGKFKYLYFRYYLNYIFTTPKFVILFVVIIFSFLAIIYYYLSKKKKRY